MQDELLASNKPIEKTKQEIYVHEQIIAGIKGKIREDCSKALQIVLSGEDHIRV